MKVTLVEKHPVSEGVETFIFEPEQPLAWKAGEFWQLILPHESEDGRGHERLFTISAAPFESRPAITTRIDADPMSTLKQTLRRLEIGDVIEATVPEGDFVVDDLEAEYVFLVGGIGITPVRSILNQLAHEGTMPKVQLLYANRSDEIPFRAELDKISADYPSLKTNYLIDPERLNEETIKRYVPNLTTPLFYISGPDPMVEALEEELVKLGVARDRIKTDGYGGYKVI